MASNYNEEDEQQTIITPDNPSAYDQLWQDALDVDDEVQRILQDHAMPINDDELEHAEEAEEDDGMQWVIFYWVFRSFNRGAKFFKLLLPSIEFEIPPLDGSWRVI